MLTLQSNNKPNNMMRILSILGAFMFLFSCSDDISDSGCVSRQLPNYGFDTGNTINLSLPQYSSLQFQGSTLFLGAFGVKGIYLYNSTGNLNSIVAFEASDPAHAPSACSGMTRNGIELSCECGDGNKYQLLTGQQMEGNTGHCLRAYRVESLGNNVIRVYN